MSDCVFCKIIAGEIPAAKVYEDDRCLAFKDLDPKAHIQSVDAITPENSGEAARILEVIPGIMRELGVENGYRIVTNIGPDAGQTVPHLHFHVLAGQEMGWTPA